MEPMVAKISSHGNKISPHSMLTPCAQTKRNCVLVLTWSPVFEIIHIEVERAGQCLAQSPHCLGTKYLKRHLSSIAGLSQHLPGGEDQADHVAHQHDHVDVQGDEGEVGFLIPSLYLSSIL